MTILTNNDNKNIRPIVIYEVNLTLEIVAKKTTTDPEEVRDNSSFACAKQIYNSRTTHPANAVLHFF